MPDAVYIFIIILEAVLFIAKEHADRQKVIPVLRLIPADKFDLVREKALTTSWWEYIQAMVRQLVIIGVLIFIGWLAHSIASL